MTNNLEKLEKLDAAGEILDLLNEDSESCFSSLCYQALILSERGVLGEELKAQVHKSSLPFALYVSAKVYFNDGLLTDSSAKLQRLLELPRVEFFLKAKALYHAGSLRIAQGHFHDVETSKMLCQFANMAESSGDEGLLALAEGRHATLTFLKGDLLSAQAHWTKSLKHYKNAGHSGSYGLALTYVNLGLLARDFQGYKSAIHYLKTGIELGKLRGSQYILNKAYRELFYCYIFQGDFSEALSLFRFISGRRPNEFQKIENKILESYLCCYMHDWKKARRLLLEAWVSIRQLKIGKNRFDLPFHFAHYLIAKGEIGKAKRLIDTCDDPIQKLNLMALEIDHAKTISGDYILEYQRLAQLSKIPAHIRRASDLMAYSRKGGLGRDMRISKIKVTIDPERGTLCENFGEIVDLSAKPLMMRLLLFLRSERSDFSKELLLQEVFEFNHYDRVLHDPKVYKLVSALNKCVQGRDLIVAEEGSYHINSAYIVEDLTVTQRVSPDLARTLMIIENLEGHPEGASLATIVKETGLSTERTQRVLVELVNKGQLSKTGEKRWRHYILKSLPN